MRFYQNLFLSAACVCLSGAVMAQEVAAPIQVSVQVPAEEGVSEPAPAAQPAVRISAPVVEKQTAEKPAVVQMPKTPYSILICRSKQCAKAEYSMTKEFLYNRLVKLFESNLNKDILLCDADPVSHVCYNHAIRVPAQTNVLNVDIKIPSIRLLDAKLLKGQTALDLIFDYNVEINNIRSVCQSSVTRLSVDFIDKVQMLSPGFDCRFTTTGNSALNASYNIDYVDFDYGTLGAYYTIGAGEMVRGGASGYLLMRFVERQPSSEADVNVGPVRANEPIKDF